MSASTVLAGIPVQKTGLNYLVPTPWYIPQSHRWNEFCLLNKAISDPALFQIPLLNMVDYAYPIRYPATASSSTTNPTSSTNSKPNLTI